MNKDLFGKYCVIPTGMSCKPFIYKILESGHKSNCWSEIPLTYDSENNPKHHDIFEHVLFVVCDTLIDDKSKIIRVAEKDVRVLNTLADYKQYLMDDDKELMLEILERIQ